MEYVSNLFFESSLQPVSESLSREGGREEGLKSGRKRDTDSGSPGECAETYAHTSYEPFKHNLQSVHTLRRQKPNSILEAVLWLECNEQLNK